jgi:hypothetical protein
VFRRSAATATASPTTQTMPSSTEPPSTRETVSYPAAARRSGRVAGSGACCWSPHRPARRSWSGSVNGNSWRLTGRLSEAAGMGAAKPAARVGDRPSRTRGADRCRAALLHLESERSSGPWTDAEPFRRWQRVRDGEHAIEIAAQVGRSRRRWLVKPSTQTLVTMSARDPWPSISARARDLSAELARQGMRVVGLRPQAMPETGRIKELRALRRSIGKLPGNSSTSWAQTGPHTRRLSTLEDTANMAVFMASDKASGMTGTTVDLSMGSLDD